MFKSLVAVPVSDPKCCSFPHISMYVSWSMDRGSVVLSSPLTTNRQEHRGETFPFPGLANYKNVDGGPGSFQCLNSTGFYLQALRPFVILVCSVSVPAMEVTLGGQAWASFGVGAGGWDSNSLSVDFMPPPPAMGKFTPFPIPSNLASPHVSKAIPGRKEISQRASRLTLCTGL